MQRNFHTWQPTRRNKKIGTKDAGFKSRNMFGLPDPRYDFRAIWEKLNNPVLVECTIEQHDFSILVEPPLEGFKHYISIDDLLHVLAHIPLEHRQDIKRFVFRQSKRKEEIFSSCWGRLAYWGTYNHQTGPAVILEAQPDNRVVRWGKHLMPTSERELERLRLDGHKIIHDKRYYYVRSNPQAIRNTQLYRTLIHEIGHSVDFIEKVLIPSKYREDEELYQKLDNLYFSRPSREREDYAHGYAEKIGKKLRENKIIPFPPFTIKIDVYGNLNPDWFYFGNENPVN